MRVKYVAGDGTEFEDSALCMAYERLIEASKDATFHKAVENLFDGCTSWESGPHMDDDSYKVFRMEEGRHMAKFKANLVQALPALRDQLEAALHTISD
jgi:hypothetical protein